MEVTQFLKEKQKMFQKYSLFAVREDNYAGIEWFPKGVLRFFEYTLRLSTLYQFELYNES